MINNHTDDGLKIIQGARNPLMWICYSFILVDFFYTSWAIKNGAVELNILARPIIDIPLLYSLFRLVMVPLLLLIFVVVASKHPRFQKVTLSILIAYAGAVAIYDAVNLLWMRI